jgi:hypothetical protein
MARSLEYPKPQRSQQEEVSKALLLYYTSENAVSRSQVQKGSDSMLWVLCGECEPKAR